jgi:two-component system chemotaxis sensor kinase CheA
VTELSGRGVGMDVVRRNIEALRGRIDIQTARGKGTTFSIQLPLTLAIVDGILLGVGSDRFVIPTFAVQESFRPLPEQVQTLHGQACMVQVRDRLIRCCISAKCSASPARASGISAAPSSSVMTTAAAWHSRWTS